MPFGAAMMIKVIHVVFLSDGAKASTQTGKKMAKTTWQAPEMNLAAASYLQALAHVKMKRLANWTARHPSRHHLDGNRSSNGIAITEPKLQKSDNQTLRTVISKSHLPSVAPR